MQHFVKCLTVLFILFFPGFLSAESVGRYITIDRVKVNATTTIPAGTEVNFLGTIEVNQSVSKSGELATFTYMDDIYNADATLFYKAINDASFAIHPARTFDAGNSASLCSAMARSNSGDGLTFADETFARYFKILKGQKIVDGYSVSKPKDISSWRSKDNEFCISGLEHSTSYEVTLLPGLEAKRGSYEVTLDKAISFKVTTPPVKPGIKIDSSKTILSNARNAVIPVEYININEIEVTLHRIDLASLPSYRSVLQILDGSDVSRLDSFWADKIAQKSIEVSETLNQAQTINLNFSDLIDSNASGLFVATFTSPQLSASNWENRPTQWFSISDTSVQVFKGSNTTDLFINSFKTTHAIEGAEVQIVAKNNRALFEGRTDENGRVQLSNDLISGSGGFAPSFIIVTSKNYGTSILQVSSLEEKPRFLNGGEVKAHKEDVYLTSDREIYRAGDTVHAFGVIRELNLDPVASREMTLKLLDRNNDTVSKIDIISDANGAFSESFALKSTLQLGRYTIQVEAIDEAILAQHVITLEDFVPLTIEPKLEIQNSIWSLNETQSMTLSAEYYSGGPAVGLTGEIATFVRTADEFQDERFDGFKFGSGAASKVTIVGDEFEELLDSKGQMTASLLSDYTADSTQLYEVLVQGTVFDVGGRANKTTEIIALDTSSSYVGLRPRFDSYIDEGNAPSFDVVNVNRSGEETSFEGVQYSVQRIYYEYNWFYSDGWRWNRIRVDDETVAAGEVTSKNLVLDTPLSWGRHEIILTNADGFKTIHEFYVGWGSDAKPASEPEELVLSYSDGVLRGNAGFTGKLSIMLADEDISSVQSVRIDKGSFEIPVSIPVGTEPGIHLLASLIRPIETGSEHLPQISLGKVWVPTLSPSRHMDLTIKTDDRIDSATAVSVKLDTTSETGSAVIFVVDEGIHALTDYQNKNLSNHYLDERALNYGILSNFGELISQDLALSTFRVGGDGDMLSAAAAAAKSEFFKTVTYASPILDINNGSTEFVFPQTSEWEGKLRVVAFSVSEDGFGFSESEVIVQDAVSLDVSMPRFVTPNDTVVAKMNVRWNEYDGPIELITTLGTNENSRVIEQPASNSFELEVPISTNTVGDLPLLIEVATRDRLYSRNFTLVSRQGSYPVTEVQSAKLDKKNWLGFGSVIVQPFNSRSVDLAIAGSSTSASLTTGLGVNLNQVVEELNRYPYGCVEQVSSKTRGLIAFSEVRGLSPEISRKIQVGIENLLAKQKFSGAFGYWDRNSYVYERFQPYAVDTLLQLLPYAEDQDKIVSAIKRGLEYLYRTNFNDQNVKLYAYGLLAKSGYEVTSRARYAIDQELRKRSTVSFDASTPLFHFTEALDNLTLSYWVAAQLNDTKRMNQLSERARFVLDQNTEEESSKDRVAGAWFSPADSSGLYTKSAPNNGHLLTDLAQDKISPVFRTVLSNTHEHLARSQYRSTQWSAKLVSLQKFQETSLEGTKVSIDGTEYELDATGSLPLDLDKLKSGFEIAHDAPSELYLNVKSTGQRLGLTQLDNGYKVEKFWYDRSGQEVDVSSGVLSAKQGDLFTVVVQINRTKTGYGSDLLITDLLPAGFEIEKAVLADPEFDGLKIDFDAGLQAGYTASMDDRFIAHFDSRWRPGSFALVRYSIRAAYETEALIPDAVVEEMYAPEVNGRSNITASIVAAR